MQDTFRERCIGQIAAKLRDRDRCSDVDFYRVLELALGQDHATCQEIRRRMNLREEETIANWYGDLKKRAEVLD